MNLTQRLNQFLTRLVYGPAKRGERIYDKPVTFKTTQAPEDRGDYNYWIGEEVHRLSEKVSYRRRGFNRLKRVS